MSVVVDDTELYNVVGVGDCLPLVKSMLTGTLGKEFNEVSSDVDACSSSSAFTSFESNSYLHIGHFELS